MSCAARWRPGGARAASKSIHAKLVDGMLAHGYEQEFAEAIFQQIEGFGEYGFPESHAASFALLAYASSLDQAPSTRSLPGSATEFATHWGSIRRRS